MPIADLFAAPPTSNPVGTGRNGRNIQHFRDIEAFRPDESCVGTFGTDLKNLPLCSDRSDHTSSKSEQENPGTSAPVPTVPVVPTANCNADSRCRSCGVELAWPTALGVIFADGTAECMRCCDDEVERLLVAGQRAVNPDLATDPAELMLQASGHS